MHWLVYHVASGQAFFSGIACIIGAAVLSRSTDNSGWQRFVVPAFLLGLILVVISSSAIPYMVYAAAGVCSLFWLVSTRIKSWRLWTSTAVIVAWLVAAAFEAPFHKQPSLPPSKDRTLTVIGDSVTAGVSDTDTAIRWPTLLAKQHGLQVQDISQMGETVRSACSRLETKPVVSSTVILEIGGNDVLGSTSPADFATDLDALLNGVVAADRRVVMLELPLPPFYHQYGYIQRRLARKHHVSLIPKRVFLSVLAGKDATLDTIHLTQSGHDKMAQILWKILGPSFPPQ